MIDGKSVRKKLIGNDENRAVSPVIGVILMVAITVILAAVIATMVMDIGNDAAEQEANAGASVDTKNHEILASWTSQGNSDKLNVSVEYEVTGESDDTHESEVSQEIGSVGKTASWDSETLVSKADLDTSGDTNTVDEITGTITVTAKIDGGSTTVVSTETFTFEDPGVTYDKTT
ncbi:hypothetical protein C488_14977 [Natrinema pellirubrum DSM 15624]|uniref:Archaeal flagellin-like protein n=1 Tax=Natrinema pellirubrum (strain DSM 15624 / CIP 106293 / JCM 10476 / NCIMB 786 / 157) TaxID=797303 RepID=L0JMH1_NATP1|nr:type IV pilin N-terminal domain-containing protein [Natrinema pellirubrum]AGB31772.1 archaeal flagellin-like protein [Natrinema pellirubrum DSM 15624]ELY72616.1 hypothetical protein C488_14977 [Natrinema pellirubrum DSM 15624]